MATTFVDYTGDGNATKSFSFPSYKVEDIKVDVDGVIKSSGTHYNITSYTTTGGGNVVFTSGNIPASPAQIRIFRDTDVDTAKATFTAGSSVKAADLNNNMTQILYAAQEEQNQTILSSDIKDAAISAAKLAADSVTTAKIADANVTTAKIADDAVTADKLANSINTEIAANTAKTTNQTHTGDVTGATSLTIANAAVTNAKIANDAINSDKIANDAVNSEHYAAGSIDTEHIDDLQVTTAKIANDAIVVGKIANNAVTTAKISDGNVTTAKIADDAVTSAKLANSIDSAITANTAKVTNATHTGDVTGSGALTIANDAVTTAKIADDAVTADKIANTAVTAGTYTTADITVDAQGRITSASSGNISEAEIANSAVTTAKIAADAVTGAKIADNAIDSEHYTDGSIDTAHIGNSQVTEAKIATNAVTTTKITDGNITTAKLQTAAVHTAKLNDNAVTTAKIADDAVTNAKIADGTLDGRYYTETELDAGQLDNRYYTETELNNGQLDNRYYTEAEADARFYNVSSTEEIQSGETWSAADNKIATTAAIDARIIDLVDDVGGFVPIANETSFPNANPDVNNGAGTIVSIGSLSSNLTSNGSGVITISNGTVGNSTVTITGAENSTTYNAGYGLLVETTTTLNTYTFHRLSSKATEVTTVAGSISNVNTVASAISNVNTVASNASNINTVASNNSNVTNVGGSISNVNTVASNISNVNAVAADATDIGAVAGKATEIGRLGTADAVADLAILGTADAVSDMNTLATSAIVSDMDTLADISSDITTLANIHANVSAVAGNSSNINSAASNSSNINTVAGSISNVNTTASNISNVNNFANTYQIASSNPSTDGGGNSLAAGDLYFNTSANELKVYNGSAWQGGVTATGNLAGLGANTFTGNQSHGDNVKAIFGAGGDLEIFHNSSGSSNIKDVGTGPLFIWSDRMKVVTSDGSNTIADFVEGGSCEFFENGTKRLETTTSGINVVGDISVSGSVDGVNISALNSTVSGITSNATHTGEVTGSTALTIADNVVDEANLKVSNSPTNGYFLSAQSGNTGGLTWAEVDLSGKLSTTGGSMSGNITFGVNKGINFPSSSFIPSNSDDSLTLNHNATGNIKFTKYSNGWEITPHWVPTADSARDIGTNTVRVRNGYFDTLYGDGSNLTGIAAGVTSDSQENTVAGTNAGDAFNGTEANHNTLYGYEAGTDITNADYSVAVGSQALADCTTGSGNVAVGYRGLYKVTTGYNNTGAGFQCAEALTTGYSNVAIGSYSLYKATTANQNVAIGTTAMNETTTGDENTAVGFGALHENNTGQYNVAVGHNALVYSHNSKQTALGYKAGYNSNGEENVYIGYKTGYAQTSANYNTAVGSEALLNATTATQNVAIGRKAAQGLTTGGNGQNTAVGMSALFTTQTGEYNVAIGSNALALGSEPRFATAVGLKAGYVFGSYRGTFIGYKAGEDNTGRFNTYIGDSACLEATTGTHNTAIGQSVGGSVNLTGDNNTLLGHNAQPSSASISNEVTIGDTSITKFRIPGINFTLKDNGGTPTNGHVLTVDANGEAGFAAASSPDLTAVDSNIVPDADNTRTIGSTSNHFVNVFTRKVEGPDDNTVTFSTNGELIVKSKAGQTLSLLGGQHSRGIEILNAGVIPSNTYVELGTNGNPWYKVVAQTFHGDGSSLTNVDVTKQGVFYENSQTVSSNYTVTNGKNAMAAGPITIASGVTVTVGSGETLTIV